jgi:hypothetical protein
VRWHATRAISLHLLFARHKQNARARTNPVRGLAQPFVAGFNTGNPTAAYDPIATPVTGITTQRAAGSKAGGPADQPEPALCNATRAVKTRIHASPKRLKSLHPRAATTRIDAS